MRIGLRSLLGLALSACAPATDPLPDAFYGTWDLTPPACADQDGVTRLGITGAKLEYYEWGGDIVSARPDAGGAVRVELNWWDTSDTDSNEQPIIRRRAGKLTLSPDHSGLQVAIDGETTSYIRCPAEPVGLDKQQD